MNAWGLMGNSWVAELLQQQIRHDNVRHAYLFTGPPGIGRRTFALKFAQALSCRDASPAGIPCGRCRTCRQIGSMQHIDLSIIQRQPERTRILIEQVRELQSYLKLTPVENTYRIAVCLNFEDANEAAQNAFLKTLEEAPRKAILLLTASTAEALLPTIVSRCEQIRLRPMAAQDLEEQIPSPSGMDAHTSTLIAHLAQGCPGRALQLIEHPEDLERHQKFMAESIRLIHSGIHERMLFAHGLFDRKNQADPSVLLDMWELLWTDILHESSGSQLPLVNLDFSGQIAQIAARIPTDAAGGVLHLLKECAGYLDSNVNKSLLFENILMRWPVLK